MKKGKTIFIAILGILGFMFLKKLAAGLMGQKQEACCDEETPAEAVETPEAEEKI